MKLRPLLVLLVAMAALSALAAAQTAGADFTIIALPDTQYYSESHPQIFNSQTQWIANNLSSRNIQLVVGLGDIVEGGGVITEWQTADAAVRTLDGKVPYLMAIGNHDYNKNDPANRTASTTNFNAYFGPSRYSGYSYYRGNYPPGSNENFYGVVNINGQNYLILVLEFYPRSASLNWAASVVQANPDKEVIVVTHSYEYFDNTRVALCDNFNAEYYGLGADNDGDEMWKNFISQYANISLVLNGHLVKGTGQDAVGNRADLGIHGNLVNQILSNYQNLVNGGDGYLRILKFRPSLNVIEVSTYSPYENLWKTDAGNQFSVFWHNPGTTATAGSIVGRVKNASTCSSLAGVTVSYPGGSTVTDTYGRYVLNNVPTGSYVVTAQGAGFARVSNSVNVNAGYSAELKIFVGAPATAGSITGHVSDASIGAAIAGATISFSGGSNTTDSNGNYSFANVASGTYSVTASHSGYTNQTLSVTVSAGAASTLNFQLTAVSNTGLGAIAGRVTNIATGAALSGATVGYSGGSTTTDSSGAYGLTSVAAGTYNLTAARSGYRSRTQSVTVSSGATSTLNFGLATGGKVAGTVTSSTGAVIVGAAVKISGGSISTTVNTTTNSSGFYTSSWIPVGSYTVTVSASGHTTQSKPAGVTTGTTTTLNFTMQ